MPAAPMRLCELAYRGVGRAVESSDRRPKNRGRTIGEMPAMQRLQSLDFRPDDGLRLPVRIAVVALTSFGILMLMLAMTVE